MVIEKHQKMVENGHKKIEDILTQTWWGHTRFDRIGHEIYEKFEKQPEIKAKMIEHFKEHCNKLSYYTFFNHLEKDL